MRVGISSFAVAALLMAVLIELHEYYVLSWSLAERKVSLLRTLALIPNWSRRGANV
jgi:hypothetical protein